MKCYKNVVVILIVPMFLLVFLLNIFLPKQEKVFRVEVSEEISVKIIPKNTESSLAILASLGETKYVVQNNDTIIGIAAKFWILPEQLMQANWITDANHTIHKGDVLIIPNVKWEIEFGLASWYGEEHGFHGSPMANGRIYDMYDINTIAHRTLPLNSWVRLTDERTGKSLIVKVTDRGPFTKGLYGEFLRDVDLSYGGALYFGSVEKGTIYLKIEPLGMRL